MEWVGGGAGVASERKPQCRAESTGIFSHVAQEGMDMMLRAGGQKKAHRHAPGRQAQIEA